MESCGAGLARDVLAMKPVKGIPSWLLFLMDIPLIEELAGTAPGSYHAHPESVYLAMQRNIGTCFIDQYIPRNPLSMGSRGFDSSAGRGPTTGTERIERDGMVIDSPESVIGHLEEKVFPELASIAGERTAEGDRGVKMAMEDEIRIRGELGPGILKVPYGSALFPRFRYSEYGYEHYFTAYGLYPEAMERDFSLTADAAERRNTYHAGAIADSGMPLVLRLDHDMADSRGTLADIRSLDRIWLPHFARSIKPYIDAGIRLLWHCDGNLMPMIPRLIDAGIGGFQGFQYEDGMDYPTICSMKDRDGGPLMIWAGVSVTTTLPFGTGGDVARELGWLVDNGPRVGLSLGASSSIAPSTNRANIMTLIEGLEHYREHGRG